MNLLEDYNVKLQILHRLTTVFTNTLTFEKFSN
jgi:hypothetical protein